MMGSPDGSGDPMEYPEHLVNVPAFEMTRTEVTVGQYELCFSEGACTEPAECNWGQPDKRNHPVNCVDWHQAVAFCTWAGGRLPTEAEWEYAAQNQGQDPWPWGNDAVTCDLAVVSEGDCWPDTDLVCSRPDGNTTQGLCDMIGNVWEWNQDWHHMDYNGAPTDGSAWEGQPQTFRVKRGGGYLTILSYVTSTYRGGSQPEDRTDEENGFRCAR